VPPCGNGLDRPDIEISDSRGLNLEAWCLDDWMLAGFEGLEEVMDVTEVTAGWQEGIGRNSHMLGLQELGEYNKNAFIPVLSNDSSSLTHDI
jgi:hypothetical protein